jgi:uncharacterized membrane protein HdeD (DUF308 family)
MLLVGAFFEHSAVPSSESRGPLAYLGAALFCCVAAVAIGTWAFDSSARIALNVGVAVVAFVAWIAVLVGIHAAVRSRGEGQLGRSRLWPFLDGAMVSVLVIAFFLAPQGGPRVLLLVVAVCLALRAAWEFWVRRRMR